MNIRSLTRGDGVVIGAAVLLFIASFLDFTGGLESINAWDSLSWVMSIYLAGVIGAVLTIAAKAMPQPRKVAGLDLGQFGVALTIFAAWTAFWTIIDVGSAGPGIIIGFIATLILAGAAVASPLVPALKAQLITAPATRPAPHPTGAGYGYPGAQQVPGQGYGYPGAQQQGGQPSYGGQPQPVQGGHAGQAGQPQPADQQTAAPADAFAPFWFAVPVARPLYGEDGSPTPIAELAPGTWYLAVEQRGQALIAQTQDGRRGVLQDTTGIQRG
ncbi:DUF5336 domain-containing protein [Streptomyces purpurogeneiscleroticus]|uniref:DUF5336 domain-containing protein n=1 Tax=Streptomyces purpurogeneiscleroticus TaxID=68259 RepID=UPI001CBFA578|nr:DUF5336 domain-containing protein [Streptomyces purpurogeneiscleroticus]MBZ4017312.1 hypothetical protein [Streptomyces purpurogeneiscleroticus]